MMMRGHVVSGACAGVGVAAALVHAPPAWGAAPVPVPVALAAVVITTVCVLLPDIDSRRATIVRLLGPLGPPLHRGAVALGRGLFYATRTRYDHESAGDGHRLITHTLAAAVGTGTLVACLTPLPGGLLRDLASSLVASAGDSGWGQMAALAVGTVSYWLRAGIGDWWWVWGLAAGTGHAVGAIGDTLTVSGAPLFWPVPIRGKRWYDVRTPLAFRADSEIEHGVVVPALYVLLAVSTVGALGWWPPIWAAGSELLGGVG